MSAVAPDAPIMERLAASRQRAVSQWTRALILAAQRLEVQVSQEQVHRSAAWADKVELERAIVEIALNAGLSARFAQVAPEELGTGTLPALVSLGSTVSLIIAVQDGKVVLLSEMGGKTVERTLGVRELAPQGRCKVLLVQTRGARRDGRLRGYLRADPRTWWSQVSAGRWSTLFHLAAGSIAGNVLAMATSLFAMQVWDRVVPARSTHSLWVLALGVSAALVLEFVIRTTRSSITDHFGRQVDQRLSELFFTRVLDIRNDARPRSPGQLISQLRDLDQVRDLLTSSSMGVLIDLPFLLGFFAIIWWIGGTLVLAPLAAVPLLLLPAMIVQWPLSRLSNQGLEEAAVRNAILMESIYRVEDIKTLQAEPRFRALWQKVNQTSSDVSLRQRFLAGLLLNYSMGVQQLAYVAVLVAGVYGILEGTASFGTVLACSILTSRAVAPLSQVVAVLSRLQQARVSLRGLEGLLQLPLDHDPDKDSYHKPVLKGDYLFDQVTYAYDAESRPALAIQNLRIRQGERVAVLGKVGAGKSTLLRLAAGLAAPTAGRILMDGSIMSSIDMADIRRDVAYVQQDSNLFHGTLRENMRVASPDASDDEILAAMRMSGAEQMLLGQPKGLDVHIGEGGRGLSGGQRQAIVLARALLRDPKVLLLDEPTALLDQVSEQQLVHNFTRWLGSRTLIVATHRFPILALVDRVIVVHDGRIIKDGPKAEVMASIMPTRTAGVSA